MSSETTMVAEQCCPQEWVPPLADAILDRIVHDAYMIDIVPIDPTRNLSMREVYGLKGI